MKRLSMLKLILAQILVLAVFQTASLRAATDWANIVQLAPEEIAPIEAPFDVPKFERPKFPDKEFNIKDFGAVEGGKEKVTDAIRKTVEAAAKAGGGRVVIPAGKWLTGPIHLDNNINLVVSKGAEVLFSQDFADYRPAVFARHEDIELYKFSPFIYANGKTNIGVTGGGVLNGQGKPWWENREGQQVAGDKLRKMAKDNVPVEKRIFDGTQPDNFLRTAFFQPMNCKNVLVEGVTFMYGAFWTLTPTYCENVIVRKVKVVTDGDYGHTPNGDGCNPSSCKNVLIEYCEFATGDDCIAIKSGRDEDGLRVNKPTENVIVRHVLGHQGHGGIVIGSETSGGVRNIYGYSCRFDGTDRVVRIKSARGRGGVLENFWFKDLSAGTIVNEAIHINMLYSGARLPEQPVSATTPICRNIHVNNLTCDYSKANAIQILGLPEQAVENVTIENVSIGAAKGIEVQDGKNITFSNVIVVPQKWPLIQVTDSWDLKFDKILVPTGADPVVKVDGAKSKNINVTAIELEGAKTQTKLGEGVDAAAVKLTGVKEKLALPMPPAPPKEDPAAQGTKTKKDKGQKKKKEKAAAE